MQIVEMRMLDVACGPDDRIEVLLRDDKKVLWVNIGGVCLLRICGLTENNCAFVGFWE